ncbi:MAG: GNAT family N-acetyltransferase [Acidobacteriota bacterium]
MAVKLLPLLPNHRGALEGLLSAAGVFRDDEIAVALELVDAVLQRPGHPDYAFAVAEADGAVAGYACWGPTPCTLGTFDLYWIAVHPRHQGHGIAGRLLGAAESDMAARGGRLSVIETSSLPCYEPARRFYLRAGYEEAARLRDFYAPGDHKLVYLKSLRAQKG